MQVFISWSGDTSREIASILRKYLPLMLQNIQPFMSRHDIESGKRWAEKIKNALELSSYGLILLTPSNLNAKWLLFEAGAISKLKDSSTACLLCAGVKDTDVTGPLAQFQFQKFEKEQFFQLVRDMNSTLASPLLSDDLTIILEKWWPDIEKAYDAAVKKFAEQETELKNPRDEREFQEEILRTLRIVVDRSIGREKDSKLIRALSPDPFEEEVSNFISALPDSEQKFFSQLQNAEYFKPSKRTLESDSFMSLVARGWVKHLGETKWQFTRDFQAALRLYFI